MDLLDRLNSRVENALKGVARFPNQTAEIAVAKNELAELLDHMDADVHILAEVVPELGRIILVTLDGVWDRVFPHGRLRLCVVLDVVDREAFQAAGRHRSRQNRRIGLRRRAELEDRRA